MHKAVVLVSGGVNSLVAAAAARQQYELALLHVAWGHRSAARERACFDEIAAHLKTEQTRVAEIDCLLTLAGGARVNKRLAIEDASTISAGDAVAPPSFSFGVLPALLSLAAAWAGNLGARRIILGTGENHGTSPIPISHLYPDHRREFVQAFNLMLQYAKPRDRELFVETPLLELTRPEVVKLGDVMGVPFEHTWSCFAESDEPCGRCLGCTNRTAGFLQAGVPDPLLLIQVGK
jgi:7-cyano-7-deazaguanine synthase